MTRCLCALLVAAAWPAGVVAQEAEHWSAGTAYTLPEGRTEVGVFAPMRYGWTGELELATHPLADVVIPNVAAKIAWRRSEQVAFATRHVLTYPSGLFNLMAREGVGGLLPTESVVPHIIGLNTEGLATWRRPSARWWLTGKVGVMVAGRIGEMNLATVDLPVLFARTAAYRKGWSVNVGLDADGRLSDTWGWFLDLDFYFLSTPAGRWALEQSGMLAWHPSEGLRVLAGYKIVYADYPFGAEWNLGDSWVPLPMLDVQWAL